MIADGKFLALDLELNQPSGKIIQVGIAIGDKNTRFEDYVVRKWYIDPQEPISEFINDLTGITDATYVPKHTVTNMLPVSSVS